MSEQNYNMGFFDGKVLLATPEIVNTPFSKSVIYIYADSVVGSYGFVLNIPIEEKTSKLLKYELGWGEEGYMFHGGPLNKSNGFVLHTNDYNNGNNTHRLNKDLSFTNGTGIHQDIGEGHNRPSQYAFIVGTCIWMPGQLKSETENKFWVPCDYDLQYFFRYDKTKEDYWQDCVDIYAKKEANRLISTLETDEIE